jgi:hypothetical protein
MAQVETVYQDAFQRLSEGSPLDAKGEIKESVKRLLETADRLHSWTADLLKAFPRLELGGEIRHVIEIEYVNVSEAAMEAMEGQGEDRTEAADARYSPTADDLGRDGATGRAEPTSPPPPPAPRAPGPVSKKEPESGDPLGLGWRRLFGGGDLD